MKTQERKDAASVAEFRGWRLEYIEGNGVDDNVWVSPDGKVYFTLPPEAYSQAN